MSDYLLSIVIPTKNRQRYAYEAIKQIYTINNKNIQIVIQDNSDTDELKGKINEFDESVKYNYKSGSISFVDNFSLAVENSDGEYLCIIGDDDGINPQIIDVVVWAKKNGIDFIKPGLNAVYIWPESETVTKDSDNGRMSISKIDLKISINNPKNEMEKLLKHGCQRYLKYELIKLYHGVVKKSALDFVRKTTGSYFGGLSPDIYGAVALSTFNDNLLTIEYPLTIPGICAKSGTADSSTGRHEGDLKDAPHFKGHENYEWNEYVVPIYSVETIWADSAMAALNDLKEYGLINKFNYGSLNAYCLFGHFKFHKKIIEFQRKLRKIDKNYNFFRNSIIINFFRGPAQEFLVRLKRKIKKPKTEIKYYNNIKSIIGAGKTLSDFLKENDFSTEKLIIELDKHMNAVRTKNEH